MLLFVAVCLRKFMDSMVEDFILEKVNLNFGNRILEEVRSTSEKDSRLVTF